MPPPAGYSPVKAETYPKPKFSAFYSHFQVTSSQMTSLPGHLRSREVISCHVNTSSYELQPCRSSNAAKTWLTGLLQPLPGDFRSNDHFGVTSGHMGHGGHLPRDCYLLRVAALRSSNIPKTWFIGLLQPLRGDFRSNDVTSGSLPVT